MSIEAIDRTVVILEHLAESPKGLGVVKLAERTGLAPSTAHRYLFALQSHAIVEQDESKRYHLTSRLYLLGLAVGDRFSLETQARGVLQRLAQTSQETACLVVRDGHHAVCIAQIDSNHQLKIAAHVGSRQDLRMGATSRVLLAYADEATREAVLEQAPLSRYTERTVTDSNDIRRILKGIRRDGYYMSRGEVDEGVLAVAAPVFDRRGEVIAALAIAAPESRVSDRDTLQSTVHLVTEGAGLLARKLGFSKTHTTRERKIA